VSSESVSDAMYEYSWDWEAALVSRLGPPGGIVSGPLVKVSSPESTTKSSNPGIATLFSWLCRPIP
jgi:hypothetical protein